MTDTQALPTEQEWVDNLAGAATKAASVLKALEEKANELKKQVNTKPHESRAQRKEYRFIQDKLIELSFGFIGFVKKLAEQDSKLQGTEGKATASEESEKKIVAEFVKYENVWKKFCHRKFKYHQLKTDAFSKSVAKNINMAGMSAFKNNLKIVK